MGLFVINTAIDEVIFSYGTGDVVSEIQSHDRFFAEKFTVMIENILCKVKSPEHAIAVCVGPGGYTSLRIAITAAKMLALSFSIPLIGVRSSDIYANLMNPSIDSSLLVALETNRDLFFVERFQRSRGNPIASIGEPSFMGVEEIYAALAETNCYLAGSGVARIIAAKPQLEKSNYIIKSDSQQVGKSQYEVSRKLYNQKEYEQHEDNIKPIYFKNMNS